MATTTGLAHSLPGSLAPQSATTAATTSSSVTSIQQLLDEIYSVKTNVEQETKVLEKIDTGRKNASKNRDRSVEGRTKIKELKERVDNLQNQLSAATKESDLSSSQKVFDKKKKLASKTLSDLSNKLTRADKHLEKATGAIPIPTIPAANTQPTTNPADAPTVTAEDANTKGVAALLSKDPIGGKTKATSKEPPVTTSPTPLKPADKTHPPAKKTTKDQVTSEEEESDEDDDDVVTDKTKEPEKSPRFVPKTEPIVTGRKKIESETSEDSEDEDEDDDDGDDDERGLASALQTQIVTDVPVKDPISSRESRSPTTRHIATKPPTITIDSTSSSPRHKQTTTISTPRKKTPSPKPPKKVPTTTPKDDESDEDSYFEEEDEDDEELQRLRRTGTHERVESDHDYDDAEEEPTVVNAYVQELRGKKHTPGTQFVVTHDMNAAQTGDLTIRKGEILTLVEQRDDDWWLFKNLQTQQQGVAPINYVQLSTGQQPRRRVKPSTSAITLVDAFKANQRIPEGFISSDLAPLTKLEEYQLWRALVPKMTESNLAFADLHWRAQNDQLHIQEVTHQKILTIKGCLKIPRVKTDQIVVLDRCVRVCLYDGFEIVSNIHTLRAHIPRKVDERDLTEDWNFLPNDINTLIDEQSQLLVRSNRSDPSQHLYLLFELSQWCQSTVTQEKCEVGCGWTKVPLDDDKPPLISDTKGYSELLQGGPIDEENVLLDPQYKVLRSDGLSGMIDRFKRARIKFSVESRETDVDLLYDNLPIQSIIVPLNLIKTLAFFRNELAYQLHKRHHPTGLSTTPIDSIFLSTFFQTLEQPDLIYTLRRLYRSRKTRLLSSSASSQQQREEFIKTYTTFIYPLLHYRLLPPYDFHDVAAIEQRRKLIVDMTKRQIPKKKTPPQDILSILLDPNLTDKWTSFNINESSFTLQKYIRDLTPHVVA